MLFYLSIVNFENKSNLIFFVVSFGWFQVLRFMILVLIFWEVFCCVCVEDQDSEGLRFEIVLEFKKYNLVILYLEYKIRDRVICLDLDRGVRIFSLDFL